MEWKRAWLLCWSPLKSPWINSVSRTNVKYSQIKSRIESTQGLPWCSVVKNSPANVGNIKVAGSIPVSGRSSAEGLGNPLQYSCLENPKDREAWRPTVHRVTKSQNRWATEYAHMQNLHITSLWWLRSCQDSKKWILWLPKAFSSS